MPDSNPSPGFGPDLAEVFGPAHSDGGPELVQLLTPEGERVHHPEFDLDFSAEQIRGFYRDMVLTRRIDTEATALQRCKGIDPLKLLGLFRGVDHGSWDPHEFNFGLYTIVIGAQCLHATGYAMGMQRDGVVGTGDPDRDAAVIAHFGDGASSQGDVNESFIFAASYNAPVVFFCQNNQWAISEPIERQTRIPLYQRALGFGFPGIRVDGNDVLATYAVTQGRPSSRPTPTGWVRTPRPTTPRATGSPPTWSRGSSRTRSPAWRSTCAATAWSTTAWWRT